MASSLGARTGHSQSDSAAIQSVSWLCPYRNVVPMQPAIATQKPDKTKTPNIVATMVCSFLMPFSLNTTMAPLPYCNTAQPLQ